MRSLAFLSTLLSLLLISYQNGVNSQWIRKWRRNECPSEPDLQYDALGRRQSGYLVPPQNQGFCGSCWAFAATHTFADQININSNNLVTEFSPDHLAKCSPYSVEGNGCCGGNIHASTSFFQKSGAYPETCYPYSLQNYSIPDDIAKNDEDRILYKNDNPLMCPSSSSCTNGGSVPTPQKLVEATSVTNTPSEVIAALNNGPLYLVLYVGDDTHNLHQYGCGIFTDPPTSDFSGVHAVEIVDYSSSSYTGAPFYVIKNSWDSSWGEQGYFRMVQNSRLILEIYTFIIGSGSSGQSENVPAAVGRSTCSPTKINATRHPLVNDSITFALEQLNSMNLLTCITGKGMPTVKHTSVINATEQVVAGMVTDVALRVVVTGCPEEVAILRVVVLQNMNGSLTLLDYSYSTINAALIIRSHSFCLLLVLLGFSLELIFA